MYRRNPRFSELMRQGLIVFFLRRNVVIGIFVTTVVATAIASSVLVPQYKAATSFLITGFELSDARVRPGESGGSIGQGLTARMLVVNEIGILKSTDVAGGALATLSEDWENKDFYSSKVDLPAPIQALRRAPKTLAAAISGFFADEEVEQVDTAASAQPRVKARDPLVSRLLNMVQLRPSRDTAIIEIAMEHSNPAFALAAVEAYLESYLDRRRALGQTEGATEFYRAEADKHWKKWTALTDAIQSLKSELAVVDPVREHANVVEQVNQTSSELATLRMARDEFQSAAGRIERGAVSRSSGISLPGGTSDPVLSQLQARIGELEAARADRLRTFAPESSMVKALDEEIALVRARAREVSGGVVEQEMRRQNARIALLTERHETLRARAAELERAAGEIQRLTAQANLAQEQVTAYERKYSETVTAEDLSESTLPNVGMVANPSVSPSPVFPDRTLIVGASAVLGIFMGMFIAFLQELLDDSLKLPDQLTAEFDIPVLGTFELEAMGAPSTPPKTAIGALRGGA